TFATTFYKKLLEGARFIDAVAAARSAARACGGNTWAAYQCYGDPDWTFRQQTGDGQRPTMPAAAQEFASIASPRSLILALERLALIEAAAGRRAPEQRAIKEMWTHYGKAEAIAARAASAAGEAPRPSFYPAMNRVAAQLALADGSKRLADSMRDSVEAIRSA